MAIGPYRCGGPVPSPKTRIIVSVIAILLMIVATYLLFNSRSSTTTHGTRKEVIISTSGFSGGLPPVKGENNMYSDGRLNRIEQDISDIDHELSETGNIFIRLEELESRIKELEEKVEK